MHVDDTALPGPAGIYVIRNTRNSKVYVGSTGNIAERWRTHRKMLNGWRHPNKHLQGAWRIYGADAFVFEVLESVRTETDLALVEQRWIDRLGAIDPSRGYNLRPLATNNRGVRFSAEARARLSAARMGNKNSLGVKQSAATIEKRRQKMIGRKLNRVPERNGWSDGRRAAFVKKMTGRTSPLRGLVRSPEFREKIRTAVTGRQHTPEARARMSEAQRARWEGHVPAPTYRYVKKGRACNVYDGFIDPTGEPVGQIANLRAFSLERGLSPECMYHVWMGRQRQHKGWTVVR